MATDRLYSKRVLLDSPRGQAKRIVKAWRATDQHDQLLVHYIRQAIEDNIEADRDDAREESDND